ncbi:phosphatidyl ethanolamine N-methyltransferase [Hyphopichia burtonii NRRL Y-1933]|uniref:Phosphatidylethanolamine N-methyltransferase n=1 Tax=Hyphopichia burtonii NRRL Y-1933 TaxID=984485 RepID=A0A1E4RGL3_9ASCO|nr:phosphatidyl ethanolamine N-methyltransferase [Hyphopichia burtonii NRRL Y-1933]ODV66356.1 phosphatidyl ethanolamine N-methyltransferase [Hyphopichia burtonii NRRL Y-1933]
MSKNTISGAKGITFSGETFTVPETHDMVKTLFDPCIRKSICELIIVSLLLANGLVFWLVDDFNFQIKIFIGLYIFWRLSYNFGIGWLLNQQSNHNRLVNWSIQLNIFNNENKSLLSKFMKLEIQSQMGNDYSISDYPIEFNTWLVFRKIVDLILMSDFTTFICLVVSCCLKDDWQFIQNQSTWLINSRIVIGSLLILFNLWVKINAHNTIKDYAWYWGDFFFRQINNEELIFDGVFEMVPHPMYSIGYIGYYGFALISKSYTVLVIALFGHFLQMIFLHFIENPHIDKIYGPSENDTALAKIFKLKDLKNFDNAEPLIGLWNFNWFRASDLINLIISITYAIIIPFMSSIATNLEFRGYQITIDKFLFSLTVAIKLFESIVVNVLLLLQSYNKFFTKWYLLKNIPVSKSLNNWSVLYNSLINLTYSSFIGFNFYNLFTIPLYSTKLLIHDYLYLRIFFGFLLVITQIWINSSIIDLIGYFGWFYGDFFIPKSSFLPHRSTLTKAGVYRYLNNPEQIFGNCGIIGITLIIPNVENIIITLIWVTNNFLRNNFIEKVHMIKIYGEDEVLKDSGVTKTFKTHLLPDVIQRRISHGQISSRDIDYIRSTSKSGHKRRRSSVIAESIDNFIKDLNINNYQNKISKKNLLSLSANDEFSSSDYGISFQNLSRDKSENHYFTYMGDEIKIDWKAPKSHSKKDWIGLYKIIQTSYSRKKTLILSQGRWNWCDSETEGEMSFKGNQLFWDEGIYEFRYHLDGKHEVAFISPPFEIKINQIEVPFDKDEEEVMNFANSLKTSIFDKIIGKEIIGSVNTSILSTLIETTKTDIIKVYEKLSKLISKSTGIKIHSKFLIYYEDENGDESNEFTIKSLSLQLININKILHDLSNEDDLSNDYIKKTE